MTRRARATPSTTTSWYLPYYLLLVSLFIFGEVPPPVHVEPPAGGSISSGGFGSGRRTRSGLSSVVGFMRGAAGQEQRRPVVAPNRASTMFLAPRPLPRRSRPATPPALLMPRPKPRPRGESRPPALYFQVLRPRYQVARDPPEEEFTFGAPQQEFAKRKKRTAADAVLADGTSGVKQNQNRVQVRKLVCRWFVEQSRKKAAKGRMTRATTTTTTTRRERAREDVRSSSPTKLLSEPELSDGRAAMASRYNSWQLLRLPLCREAMEELSRGGRNVVVGGPRGQGPGSGRGSGGFGGEKSTVAAWRLDAEDTLPPCDGPDRVSALVAVSRDSFDSSSDVAGVLIAHLPAPPRGAAAAGREKATTTPTSNASSSSSIQHHDDFTTVHVVSHDLENELRSSPFPQAYPVVSETINNNTTTTKTKISKKSSSDDAKMTTTTTETTSASDSPPRVSIDDGFYSSYRQYCALQQRAWEIGESSPTFAAYKTIGESFAGRDIFALSVYSGGALTPPKKRVLVLGGQHAREWISPAAVTHAAENLAAAAAALEALRRVEVVFVPIVNPDGYERTYISTPNAPAERFWRKNTRTLEEDDGGSSSSSSCVGVDLNRNWGTAFGDPAGSSSDPCDGSYRGPSAFSELETDAV